MDCPFDSPRCLCQYCSLERCPSCDKENQRCGLCVENGKQMWTKILCKNFTPKEGINDILKENLRVMHLDITEEELDEMVVTITMKNSQ